MRILIQARGSFTQDNFEEAASFVEDVVDEVVVDLRRVYFIDGYCMVALLTIITLNSEAGVRVRLRLPQASGARTYLARMRFFKLLPSSVELDGKSPQVGEHAKTLVELSRLNIHEGEEAIHKLCEFAAPQLPTDMREEFVAALAEVGGNVIFHSAATVGFVCGQRFERGYGDRRGPRLQLVVGDAGIGIRNSLQVGEPEASTMTHKEAIAYALREGITSQPGVFSGLGLTTVRDYAEESQGILRIRSGRGSLVERRGKRSMRDVPELPGTIVFVELCRGAAVR